MCFSLRIFDQQFTPAIYSTILIFLCGGSGFLTWIFQHEMKIQKLLQFNYIETIDGSNEVYWKSILSQMFFDDKNCIYGFPIILCIFIIFYTSLFSNEFINLKHNVYLMFLAGILTSILPFLHRESFFGVLIVSGSLILSNPLELYKKPIFASWFIFFIPLICIGLPSELFYIIRTVLAPPIENGPKTAFAPPYMRIRGIWYLDKAFRKLYRSSNSALFIFPFLFWTKSLCLYVPLYFISIFQIVKRIVLKPKLKQFIFSGIIMFFIINFIRIFPSKMSNIQIIQIWIFISSFVLIILLKHFCKRKIGAILAFVLFASLIFTSSLSMIHRVSQKNVIAFHQEEIYVSSWIDENIPKDKIIISISNYDNIANVLNGRALKLGYKPWLYELGHFNTTAIQNESTLR